MDRKSKVSLSRGAGKARLVVPTEGPPPLVLDLAFDEPEPAAVDEPVVLDIVFDGPAHDTAMPPLLELVLAHASEADPLLHMALSLDAPAREDELEDLNLVIQFDEAAMDPHPATMTLILDES